MNIEGKLAAEGITLLPQQVHVWRVELDRNSTEIRQFRAMLSEEEQKRADRFHFEHDRSRFIVGRGMLRSLLGNVFTGGTGRDRISVQCQGETDVGKC